MNDLLAGVLLVILGATICFFGLRVFFIALPIWGFITGVYFGAAVVQSIFGDRFLSDLTSWIIGFLVGLLFAVLSYAFWYIGAIIAAGSVGALIGSGLMAAVNVDSGWIVFTVAAIFAVIVAIAAVIFFLPVYVVVISSAFVGAATIIAGALLVLDRINLEQLSRGATWAIINESWWWFLTWAVIGCAGLYAQLRSITAVRLPDDRWSRSYYT